jgi:dynein heavy chain
MEFDNDETGTCFDSLCVGFFAAMTEAGGERKGVDPRFVSKVNVFNMTFPSDDAVKHIYRSILAGHTSDFVDEIQTVVPVIVEMTLSLYKVRHAVLHVA